MSAYQPHYFFNKPLAYLCLKFFVKDLLAILKFFLILPWLIKLIKISSFSDTPFWDLFKFGYAYMVQSVSFICGEWIGLLNMAKFEYIHRLDNKSSLT